MAPPKNPNTSQQRWPVVPPTRVHPLSPVEPRPARELPFPAPAPPVHDQAERLQHLKATQPERLLEADRQRDNEQHRDQDQMKGRENSQDQRGDKTAREIVKSTNQTPPGSANALPPTSVIPKKKESATIFRFRVKTVETMMAAQEPRKESSSDDAKKPLVNQDDADARADRCGAAGKPEALEQPEVESTTKGDNSILRAKAVTDNKEPASIEKKTVSVPAPQKPISNPNPLGSDKARTPDKSEEVTPNDRDIVAGAKAKELDSAKKLGPVSQRNTTPSPTKKPPLTGIHLAYAARATSRSTPPKKTSPRGAKRSHSTGPSDGDQRSLSRAIKKVKKTKIADGSRESNRIDATQPPEASAPSPASQLTQRSAKPTKDDLTSPKAQTESCTETQLTLVEPDVDMQMTSGEPETPNAPKPAVNDVEMADTDDRKGPQEPAVVSEEKMDLECAKDQQKEISGTLTQIETEKPVKVPEVRQEKSKTKVVIKKKEPKPKEQEMPKVEEKSEETKKEETPEKKVEEKAGPVETPKKRKIVITRKPSHLPTGISSPAPAPPATSAAKSITAASDGRPFTVQNHRQSSYDQYEFHLEIRRPGVDEPYWVEEEHLFMESPETVVKYWESVSGGRESVCDGMWKIYKIWEERKQGRKTKYLVGWIGSLDRGWEWRNMLLTNASEVLADWEEKQSVKQAEKEAKEEGADYEFDAEQQQQAERDDDDDEDDDVPLAKHRRSVKPRASQSKQEKAAAATAKKIKVINRRN